MVGKYEIEIYNKRVHYFLTVKRNITILQGNSATGKTELMRLIRDYEENGISSGVTVKADVRCTVLTTVDWELRLRGMNKCIIFIDETAGFIRSKKFAECVRGSDNYFVIATRDALDQLSYSVDEIYGLRTDSSKYQVFKKVYNEMYRIYNMGMIKHFDPEIVLTEDTNSGYQCFSLMFSCDCVAAGGKSRIYREIRKYQYQKILVIVDGAAFGAEMGKVSGYLGQSKQDCTLYAPESFEYLILESGILDVPDEVINETYQYADSCTYLSWEEFYTSYLVEAASGTVYQYRKSSLGKAYRTVGVIRKMTRILPEQIRPFYEECSIRVTN